MTKVTSKRQVTLPKALAERYGIEPGDRIVWEAAGDVIRVRPEIRRAPELSSVRRLELFDGATLRQEGRNRAYREENRAPSASRGWVREDLYDRGNPDRH